MKTLAILLVLVAAASALRVMAPHVGQARNQLGGGSATAGAGAGAAARQPVNYGPKVYGPGANNLWALPPNPFTIQRAVAIANAVPNVLVRLDTNGEVVLTNTYGQEVEVQDSFGRDIEID